MRSRWRKGIAGALAAALVLSQAWGPVPALAAVRRTIEEFEELSEEIQYQTVAYGTEKKALNLPKYLSALVASESEDREDQGNEDQGDKGEGDKAQGDNAQGDESQGDEGQRDKVQGGEDQGDKVQGGEGQDRQAVSQASPSQAEEEQSAPVSTGSEADRAGSSDSGSEEDSGNRERNQEWKRVKVSWELEQSFSEQDVYDGEVPGLYVFEAKLAGDRYELGGAELPQITVEVLEEEEQGTPSEAGRKQRLVLDWTYLEAERLSADGGLTLYGAEYDIAEAASRLPARIQAEIEDDSDEEILDLTWECRDCEGKLTAGETYRFDGELPRGYSLAESAAEASVWVTLSPAAELSLEEQARAMEQEMTAAGFRSARSNGAAGGYRALSGRTFVIGGELVLRELAEKVNSGATWADGQISYADSSYILTDDIGLTETWTPIGNAKHPFAGTFDGDGYTVAALRIRENAGEGAGLFGVVESGTVQNLGVTAAEVEGEGNIGIIAGTLRGGVIRRCFTSGFVTVSGEGGNAGGIAGCMEQDGSAAVLNCHSKAQVNGVSGGLQKLGGIVGSVSAGQVAGCYSTGVIVADRLNERFLGGVAGLADSGAAIRSCAALNLSVDNFTGATANANRIVGVEGAVGSAISEAALENNYAYEGIRTNAGDSYWNGNGADTPAGESLSYTAELGFQPALDRVFTSKEGWETGRSQLPVLSGIRGQDKAVPDWITSGISTTRSLSSEADLKAFRDDVNAGNSYEYATVRLTADIDLTENWTPIGTNDNPFKGTFDGEGHVISGMKIDTPDQSECGFFGVIAGGTIKNLGLKNVDIKGRLNVGAVVGLSESGGTISSCYSDGRIDAYLCAGGIIGKADGVRIENCHSAVAVEVEGIGGGIVGVFTAGNNIMKNCYSTGCLTGRSMLGGLLAELGDAANTISNCAALNPSIAELNHNKIGYRVVNGNNPHGTRKNNFAFSAMKVNGAAITEDDSRSMNGKDLTYNHTTQTFDTGWEAIFDSTEAWIIEPGRLPVLKGVGGQDGAMPQWITDSEAADLYIGTEAELRAFRDRVNSADDDIYNGIKDKRVVLTADIFLTKEWEPIGAWTSRAFQGTFEGGGHVIRGLRQSGGGCGLFGFVEGGAVRNLGLEDARLTGNAWIGAIAGNVIDGQIEGCYSRGSVVEGVIAGGLAGAMSGNSAVRNSYSTGVVRGEIAAGLVGGQRREMTGPSDCLTVENSYSIVTVISEDDMAGGLVGSVYQLQVRDSAALNGSLRESTGGSGRIHRIGAIVGDLTAENNWAFSDMPVNGKKAAGDDGTGLNGRDGAREAITGNAVLFPDSSWVRAQGCYPVLRAFAGQEPFSYADSLDTQAEKFAAEGRGGSGDSGDAYTGVLNGTWERLENGSWKFRLTGGGYAAYRWGLIDGRWYYFDADGRMATGWLYLNDVWYCLATAEDAVQLTGIKEGDMITGWYYDRRLQRWFYLEANGVMAVGWKEIDGKWYYFNPVSDGTRGAMTVDAQVDGYALGADGAAL